MSTIDHLTEAEIDEVLESGVDQLSKPWIGKVSIGEIKRIFPHSKGCYVTLKSHIPADSKPEDGFFLELTHPNYQSLFALILDAAIQDRRIKFRTTVDIDSTPRPPVAYVTIDY